MTQTDLQQLACNMLDIDTLPHVFTHLKTGDTYLLTDVCLNCTNGQENIVMAIYRNAHNMYFCRDIAEFKHKFKKRVFYEHK